MYRRLLLMVAVTALAASACGGDEVITGQHLLGLHNVDRNRAMPYLLWLPEGFDHDPAEGYPMIVSLHGTGPMQYSPEFVMRYGLPAVLAQGELPDGFEFVVLAPQALNGVDWWAPGQAGEVDEIVATISSDLPIDSDRIYLTGFSTGGQGAWHIATRHPDRYAALVSIAGSGFRSTGAIDDSACRLSSVPIWGIHGEEDVINPHDIIRDQVAEWESLCGSQIRWTSYPGIGHYQAFELAYREPELYEWLLQHSLD